MSGHSHWAGIKHKKGLADQKRGQLFSKLLNAVSIAARTEPNPEFNPRLRTAVEKAKESKVPQENIERAIKRASEDKNLEELIVEAYGPEGTAILIEIITDSKNRTIAEVKKILDENGSKIAEPGSVRWAFQRTQTNADETQNYAEIPHESASSQHKSAIMGWQEKFKQPISTEAQKKLQKLIEELLEQNEVQEVYTNT